MTHEHPTATELIRQILEPWVAQRIGALEPDERTALDLERPGWECEAARLIAEGLLAYVITEMVQPDLAYQRQADPHAAHSTEDLTARLTAHMLDFIDYRDDLPDAEGSGD
jgi:hypothetical protein